MALAKARGEVVLGMVVRSSSKICLHLGAMERSHSGVELRPRSSLVYRSGSVEEDSARMCVNADRSGCGRGARMVGLAHSSSLLSRK